MTQTRRSRQEISEDQECVPASTSTNNAIPAIVHKCNPRIIAHQGPLKPDHYDYNGSAYNVMVKWENGEITTEPLAAFAADNPVTCAIYARTNNLLHLPGWKRFHTLAKRQKMSAYISNHASLRSFTSAPTYKHGFEITKNYVHVMQNKDDAAIMDKWGVTKSVQD